MDLMMMMIVFALSSAQKVNQRGNQKITKEMRGFTNHNNNAWKKYSTKKQQ